MNEWSKEKAWLPKISQILDEKIEIDLSEVTYQTITYFLKKQTSTALWSSLCSLWPGLPNPHFLRSVPGIASEGCLGSCTDTEQALSVLKEIEKNLTTVVKLLLHQIPELSGLLK